MKKKIFVVISMLILVFAFTACGSNDNSGSGEAAVATGNSLSYEVSKDGKSFSVKAKKPDDGVAAVNSGSTIVIGDKECVSFSGKIENGGLNLHFINQDDTEELNHMELTGDIKEVLELAPGTYEVYVYSMESPSGYLDGTIGTIDSTGSDK